MGIAIEVITHSQYPEYVRTILAWDQGAKSFADTL